MNSLVKTATSFVKAGLCLSLEGMARLIIFQSEPELFLLAVTSSKVWSLSASCSFFLTKSRECLKFIHSVSWRDCMNCFRRRSRDLIRSLISWFTKGHGLLRSLICFTGACKRRTDCKVSFKILSLESTSVWSKIVSRESASLARSVTKRSALYL